jgi:hypothetical protein
MAATAASGESVRPSSKRTSDRAARLTLRLCRRLRNDLLDAAPGRLDGGRQDRSVDAELIPEPHARAPVASQDVRGGGKGEIPQRMLSDAIDGQRPPDGVQERRILVAQCLERAS